MTDSVLCGREETTRILKFGKEQNDMMNYNTMLAGLKDLVDNPTPRVPVALCLDVSGSMAGTPIAELNAGVAQYLEEMRRDDLTLCSAETALVLFGNAAGVCCRL